MNSEPKYLYWLELPEGQLVKFGDLPGLIAGALHSDAFAQAGAEINLETELGAMVDAGTLCVRDPLSLGPHTFPIGAALRRAVLMTEDLRPLLRGKGIELRLIPFGTGPELWTIENAAAAIGNQEGWHMGAIKTLRDQMVSAAETGALTVRHPHTDLPFRPDSPRAYYELVTPADVNAWLAQDPVSSLQWRVKAQTVEQKPAQTAKVNKLKSRRHALSGVIAKARATATDGSDYLTVWPELVRIATGKDKPAELVGYVESEGIQYLADSGDAGIKYFTKKALKEMFAREAKAR